MLNFVVWGFIVTALVLFMFVVLIVFIDVFKDFLRMFNDLFPTKLKDWFTTKEKKK